MNSPFICLILHSPPFLLVAGTHTYEPEDLKIEDRTRIKSEREY